MGKRTPTRAARRAAGREAASRIGATMQVSQTTMVSGPIPAADEMARYHDIDPLIVGRIFDLTEAQQSHRMLLETTMVQGELAAARRGTYVGGAIILTWLILSFYLIETWHSTLGSTSGAADLVTVLAVSGYSQHQRRRERMWRAKLMAGLDPD